VIRLPPSNGGVGANGLGAGDDNRGGAPAVEGHGAVETRATWEEAFNADSVQLAPVPVPTTHARAGAGRVRHGRSRASPKKPLHRNCLPKHVLIGHLFSTESPRRAAARRVELESRGSHTCPRRDRRISRTGYRTCPRPMMFTSGGGNYAVCPMASTKIATAAVRITQRDDHCRCGLRKLTEF